MCHVEDLLGFVKGSRGCVVVNQDNVHFGEENGNDFTSEHCEPGEMGEVVGETDEHCFPGFVGGSFPASTFGNETPSVRKVWDVLGQSRIG